MRLLALVSIALVVLAPAARGQEVAPAASSSRSIDCGVEESELRDVMDEISRRVGRPIIVDPDIHEKVTIALKNVGWRDAVTFIAALAHCDVEKLGEDTLLLTQPPRVTIQFNHANVRTVIQLLAAYSGKTAVIAPGVRGDMSIDMHQVHWKDALASILKTTGNHAVLYGSAVAVLAGAKDPVIEGGDALSWPFEKDEALESAKLQCAVEDADLSDVCAAVSKDLGQEVTYSGDPAKVTLTFRGHAHDGLLALARMSGCTLEKKKGGFALVRPARVTLEVTNTPIKEFFEKLGQQANERIAVDDDVKGEVTLSVDNCAWRDVVAAVATALDLRVVKDTKAALRVALRSNDGGKK